MATKLKPATVKAAPPRRIGCVYGDDNRLYEGRTAKEAFYECCDENGPIEFDNCTFYEVRQLRVEMQIIERQEPIVVG